jgi:hypothetical protein
VMGLIERCTTPAAAPQDDRIPEMSETPIFSASAGD